jgi:hypothetical protein
MPSLATTARRAAYSLLAIVLILAGLLAWIPLLDHPAGDPCASLHRSQPGWAFAAERPAAGHPLYRRQFARKRPAWRGSSETDFSGANLSEADLRNTDLRNAYSIGADLTGATLVGADLTGPI